jgi:GlcNAc-P-P-Und epimerase
MKYLLIGGSGFIGQHFVKILNSDLIANLDIDSGTNNSDYINCNILNNQDLDNYNIDTEDEVTLILLAAVHFDFQKSFFETNVEGTKNVLNFISKNTNIKKFVFFSSVATYGNSQFGKDESSEQIPINDYGKSKLEAEKVIFNWLKTNKEVQTIIIRPAVVFGEYNFGNVFNLIQQIKSKVFAIIGDGQNIKSIAYAGNIVDSVIFCLNNIKDPLFIYNYCDYPQKNISEQSNIITSIFGYKKPFKVPFWITKFITFPIDLFEILLKRDLKINSMRIKKFTIPTYFIADKIRKKGFKQKTTINDAFVKTNSWINSKNINTLRNTWMKKASKL